MLKRKLMDSLTEEQQEKVFKEINYSKKQLELDIQLIKDWLKEQVHLPPSRLIEDDQFFETYLTGAKGSLETVKKRLNNLYTIRSYSEIFENRDPLEPNYVASKQFCKSAIIPRTSPTGERLYIASIQFPNVDQFNQLVILRHVISRMEIHLRQAGISSRVYILIDMKDTPSSFVLKLNPSLVKDFFFFLENAISMRIMKFSLINIPTIVQVALNKIILPNLSKKLSERLQFCSEGLGDVVNYFSPEMLPRDYGGVSSNPCFQEYSDKWSKFEEENRSWFVKELSEKVDESKRIKTDDLMDNSYFGVHGSLKKLVVD